MNVQHPEWLKTLGRRRADLPVSEQVRGQAISHLVRYPGDLTSATLTGTVKSAPDATAALATFTVGTPVFEDGETRWVVSLTGAQTGALPADSDADGVEYFVYDFLLNNARLFGGLFPLSGFVTEPA